MSDFLFARPSFLFGAAKVIDIFGLFDSYNASSNSHEADCAAIYLDWKAIGYDLEEAIVAEKSLANEQKQITD